jgi:hypothetical protein
VVYHPAGAAQQTLAGVFPRLAEESLVASDTS